MSVENNPDIKTNIKPELNNTHGNIDLKIESKQNLNNKSKNKNIGSLKYIFRISKKFLKQNLITGLFIGYGLSYFLLKHQAFTNATIKYTSIEEEINKIRKDIQFKKLDKKPNPEKIQ